MTIIVSPESAATLSVSAQDVECLVTPVQVSNDSGAVVGSFYDSKTLTTNAASTWLEYIFAFPLNQPTVLENQSPDIITISGMRATKAASDVGFVNVRVGTTAKSVECDMRVTGGQSFSFFDGYETGTVSKSLYDAVVSLLDPVKENAYFNTQNHASGTYTRNVNCWLAGVNMECLAVASKAPGGEWTRRGAPILIAPQVVAMCEHFSRAVGSLVRFADASGNVVTRTIVGVATTHPTTGDMQIGVLDSPVIGVNPCPVVGAWIEQNPVMVNSVLRSSYLGGAGFWIDQFGDAYGCVFGKTQLSYGYGVSGTYGGETLINVPNEIQVNHEASYLGGAFTGFYKTPIPGDSGHCGGR